MALEDFVPAGPDRKYLIKHLYTTFNQILDFINRDNNGPQKKEVYWILEQLRRSIQTYWIFKRKTQKVLLENEIDQIFKYIYTIIDVVFESNPLLSTGANIATDELRRMVKRKSSKRKR